MDLNYPRNTVLKKINHPDLVERRDKMKEKGEQVIVPRLSSPRDPMIILERARRMTKKIRMGRMIILWWIGILRMILRIHRIGTYHLPLVPTP
jgi:hypothetical protein